MGQNFTIVVQSEISRPKRWRPNDIFLLRFDRCNKYPINREEKTAILLVEQNASAAFSIANYGYILENGRVVLEGSSEKLMENEDVKEFYLGLSHHEERKSYREVKHYKRRKRWIG